MSLNDVIQLAAVAVILIGCIVWVIARIRRRKGCSCCDSASCPLRGRRQK